jgi:dehydrogenase/reductase SDR family protein 7B
MDTKEAVLSEGGSGDSVHVLQMDLAVTDSLTEKAEKTIELYGQVDILINNGGVSSRSSVLETAIATDQQVMAVNYFGAVALTKAILPHMISRGSGHIVAVSSIQGKVALPFRSTYSASKHALEAFFESLRSEVVHSGIQVTLFCPGYINTQLSVNALTGDGTSYGVTDISTQQGMSPGVVAARMVASVACEEEEVIIAPLDARAAVYLRSLCPFVLRKILKRRARKKQCPIDHKTK